MATETTNYHFIKPGDTDPVDNTPLNQNFDSIDTIIAEVSAALSGKVDKATGKGLSTNDYTTAEKEKLAGIEAQANKTTVDNALDNSSTNPVQNNVLKSALDSKLSHEVIVPSGSILEYVNGLEAGFYTARQGYSTGTDKPISNGGFAYLIFVLSANTAQITAFETVLQDATTTPNIFTAVKTNGVWRSWYKQAITSELHALLPNITSSTTIRDYVDSLSKGVYTAFIANVSNPSDSPINANCFVNIYVYSATTAAVELIPIASDELSRTYTMRKIAGAWREWYMVEGTPVTSSTQSTATLMSAKSTSELDVMPEEGAMQS